MKKVLGFILVLCLILSGTVAFAEDIYIIQQEPDGFSTQASKMSSAEGSSNDIFYYISSAEEYVTIWNQIAGRGTQFDNLIVMVHGGYSTSDNGGFLIANYDDNTGRTQSYICQDGDQYNYQLDKTWDDLNILTNIRGNILLLSCNGGTGNSTSAGYRLAKRTVTKVICAKDSNVSYWPITYKPRLNDTTNGTWVAYWKLKTGYRSEDLGYFVFYHSIYI